MEPIATGQENGMTFWESNWSGPRVNMTTFVIPSLTIDISTKIERPILASYARRIKYPPNTV